MLVAAAVLVAGACGDAGREAALSPTTTVDLQAVFDERVAELEQEAAGTTLAVDALGLDDAGLAERATLRLDDLGSGWAAQALMGTGEGLAISPSTACVLGDTPAPVHQGRPRSFVARDGLLLVGSGGDAYATAEDAAAALGALRQQLTTPCVLSMLEAMVTVDLAITADAIILMSTEPIAAAFGDEAAGVRMTFAIEVASQTLEVVLDLVVVRVGRSAASMIVVSGFGPAERVRDRLLGILATRMAA